LISQWWSWGLSLVGALGYLLAVRGLVAGLWIGLGNQLFWATYAVISDQPGYWFSVALFGAINIIGLVKYFKAKRVSGPTPKRGREYCD